MILEPNRQRRNRVFRVVAVIVALLFVGGVTATGWTLPAFSVASATTSPLLGTPLPAAPSATTPPVAVIPTPDPTTAPPPTPAPTPGADGCIPPPADLQPATVVSHGPRTSKVIALTFDDGNNPSNVALIREFLVRNRVNATFFPTARAIELAPETWQRVAAAGFPIANHTYHHLSLAKQCVEKQLAELEKAKRVVAAQGLTLQGYMRPPFEEYDRNTQLAAAAAGEGYVVLWNVDTLDWTGLSGTTIAGRAIGAGPGSIILMHTTRLATMHALAQIVAHYRKRGYTFVTIGQLLGVPGPVPFP